MNHSGDKLLNRLLDVNPNGLGLSIYPNLERMGDLADVNTIDRGTRFRQNEIRITPSRNPLDQLAHQALDDLSDIFLRLSQIPDADEVASAEILDLIADVNLDPRPTNRMQKHLEVGGFTGELLNATKRINTSLDDLDRQILSRKGLLFYTAYRAIIGMDVEDVDGIITNMLASIEKIKSYVNQDLVDRVVTAQNLKLSDEEQADLKARLANRPISYAPGQVTLTILEEFESLKQGGDLYEQVIAFLSSSEVRLPFNANKEVIANQMVNYLIEIGFQVQEDDPAAGLSPEVQEAINRSKVDLLAEIGKSNDGITKVNKTLSALSKKIETLENSMPKDNLVLLEGITAHGQQQLYKNNITTFSQLFELGVDKLKKILPKIAKVTHNDIITQAKLIAHLDYVNFLKYKEEIRNKGDKEKVV